MTQNEIDILSKDLCARLPYGVKCVSGVDDATLIIEGINPNCCGASEVQVTYERSGINFDTTISAIKLYLFPISSMTEEQRIELYKVLGLGYESHYHLSKEWEDFNNSINNNGLFLPASWVSDLNKMYNWLNKNHFDYQGLIPLGLAIDATGLNIY